MILTPHTFCAPKRFPFLTMPSARCSFPDCRKKLQLTDMECKCTHRYCGTHRLPETHACTFDYKKDGAERLTAQLVACVADRVTGDRI